MMGSLPYVELVVDYSTGEVRADTLSHRPQLDVAARSAFEAKVACDSTGSVAVRGVDSVIKGTAVWHGGALADKTSTDDGPNGYQWGVIERVLGAAIAAAIESGVSYDADAREVRRLPEPPSPPPEPARPLWPRIVTGTKIVVALAAVVAFAWVYDYFGFTFMDENRANGEECSSDSDCASRHCLHDICQPHAKNLADGERCETNDNCASGDCNSKNVCVSR